MIGSDFTYTSIRQENEYPRLLQATVPLGICALNTTNALIYAAPEQADFVIERLFVANVTSAADTLQLHFVEFGGSVATANAAYLDLSVPANTTVALGAVDGVRLNPGTSIYGSCATANALNFGGSGIEVRGFQE